MNPTLKEQGSLKGHRLRFLGDIKKGVAQSKAFIATNTLSATGWQARTVNPEGLLGEQVYLYVWDRESNWAWSCSLSLEQFNYYATKSAEDLSQASKYCDTLAAAIREISTGRAPTSIGDDWESLLAMLVSAYAGTTKTWELSKRMSQGGHFFVCHYSRTNSSALLRPAVRVDQANSILPAAAFWQTIKAITDKDRESHPEWFKS